MVLAILWLCITHIQQFRVRTARLLCNLVQVNQVVGPILFRIAIRRVGEAGKGSVEGVFDADADIPAAIVIGSSATSMSVATHLLKKRWNVHLVRQHQPMRARRCVCPTSTLCVLL
jgi:hypothetical protein